MISIAEIQAFPHHPKAWRRRRTGAAPAPTGRASCRCGCARGEGGQDPPRAREGVPQGEVPPLQRQNVVAGQGGYGGQQHASALAHALGAEHLQELLQG